MKLSLALLLCLIPVASCAPRSDRHLPASERIDRMLSELEEDGEFAGSVLVTRQGEILLRKGYGFANREDGLLDEPETTHQLASVSKLFTRQLVLQEAASGRLSLDDPLLRFFPDFRAAEGITVRHLLNHTSGIPDANNRDSRLSEAARAATPRSREEMLAIFQEEAPLFAPGTGQHYSSPGYSLLAYLLEDLKGKPFAEVLREGIFEPLGLTHTTYGEGENAAIPYWREDGELVPAPPIECGHYIGASCVHSNVDDLFRWYEALYRGALLGEMATGKQGLGSHYGHSWGSTTGFVPVPSEDLLVVVLSNYGHAPVQSIIPRIYTILFEPRLIELDAGELEAYGGEFLVDHLGSMEHVVEIRRRGSGLLFHAEEGPPDAPAEIELRPIGNDRFVMYAGGVCLVVLVDFERDENGEVSGLRVDSSGLVLRGGKRP